MEVPILGVFSCNAVGVAASCRFEALGRLLSLGEHDVRLVVWGGFLGMDWVLGLGSGGFVRFVNL